MSENSMQTVHPAMGHHARGRSSAARHREPRGRCKALPRRRRASPVWAKFLLAVLMGAVLSTSVLSAAQAGPLSTVVTMGSRVFPSGALLPGGVFGRVSASAGSAVTLTAPEYLYSPSSPPGAMGTVYEFMFWDANHHLFGSRKATFRAAAGAAPRATAWYLQVCVTSSCGGGESSAVTTWAFSLTDYKVLPGTPISSVTPSSAWTSPSTSVSTATTVEISALPYFGASPSATTGSTGFNTWFVFGAPSTVTVSGLNLSVPAGLSPYAIAFYLYVPPGYKPPPDCKVPTCA